MTFRQIPTPSVRTAAVRDAGGIVQGLAPLAWIAQAAWLAAAVQGLAEGRGQAAVWLPAAGIVALGVIRACCEAWGARRVFERARGELSRLRAKLAESLAAGSPLDRTRPASGLAASVIAEQVEAIVPWLTRYQPARFRVMVVPICIALAVACVSWAAALVLVLAAPLIPLFMAVVGLRAKAASEARMSELGDMNALLLDRLRGLATLRALDAVDATASRVRSVAEALRTRTMSVLRIAFLSSGVLELFSSLTVALVAVYVGFHLLGDLNFGAWGRRLNLGQGLFVLLLAPAFFEPLRELSSVWHDRAAGGAALAAIDRLSQREIPLPGAHDAAASVASAAEAPAILVRGLRFAHPGEAALFDDHHFRIGAGEHVALVGASGAGKTTLLALIAGLLPVSTGEILIGNVRLGDDTAAMLRARMGWMGQRPHVFAGPVHANVTLGRAGIDAQRVESAMRLASLDRVAQASLGNALGEGGTGLSGGEAARLGLARLAAGSNAGLLLVDEPTAHLDGKTADEVADALLRLARGRTLLVATHDPRVIARMGRVLRLDAPFSRAAA